MPQYQNLSTSDLEAVLPSLPGWSLEDGKLHKTFKLKDFSAAFAFMTQVAMDAHLLDHHPEWSNVWNTVVIELVTHHAGGITNLDVELAKKIETYGH
jgi:4a-hydroxytetrahydrobiopterin dehydratase